MADLEFEPSPLALFDSTEHFLGFSAIDKLDFDFGSGVTFDFPSSPEISDTTPLQCLSPTHTTVCQGSSDSMTGVEMSSWSSTVLALDTDFALSLGPIVDRPLSDNLTEQTPPTSPSVALLAEPFSILTDISDPSNFITHIDPSMIDLDMSAPPVVDTVFKFEPLVKSEATTDSEEEEVDVDVVTIEDNVLSDSQRLTLAQLHPYGYLPFSVGVTPVSSAASSPLASPSPQTTSCKAESPAAPKQRFSPYKTGTKSIEHKRQTHNQLERKRREDLKTTFEALCAVVPDCANDARVSKLQILQGAGDHMRLLRQKLAHFSAVRDGLRNENAQLLERLRQLQAQAI